MTNYYYKGSMKKEYLKMYIHSVIMPTTEQLSDAAKKE